METSMRYSKDQKQLFLHAKEKFFIDNSFFLQVHGKLNTHTGAASGLVQFKRKFYPEIFTNLDVGAKYDSEVGEFSYDLQGKKTLPITGNKLLSVDIKGGYNFSPGLKKGNPRGVVELTYKIFNFTEDQDLRLKIGYNAFEKSRLHVESVTMVVTKFLVKEEGNFSNWEGEVPKSLMVQGVYCGNTRPNLARSHIFKSERTTGHLMLTLMVAGV